MKKQVFNPYLPAYEYIPDGEPHVFNDRLYIFGSHDRAGGTDYCMDDYVTWSAPVNDLSNWRYEGVIFRKDQDPRSKGKLSLYAPDVVCGIDGKYYLYYSAQNTGVISVAVASKPAGPYEYYGDVRRPDGSVWGERNEDYFEFDPAVLIDDDRRIWLYSGSGQEYNRKFGRQVVGAFVHELMPDMLTTIGEPKIIMPYEKFNFFKHAFFEGSSIRKYNGIYYFIYASTNLTGLNYCTSKYPDRDFEYQGIIHCTSDIGYQKRKFYDAVFPIGNYHGSVEKIGDKYYVFDHRMTNRTYYSRQGVAEEVTLDSNGKISHVESTSCGLNGKPLVSSGTYPAYIACNLFSKKILGFHNPYKAPYITHLKENEPENCAQYITDIKNGSQVGFKYFEYDGSDYSIGVEIRGSATGIIEVSDSEKGKPFTSICIDKSEDDWKWFTSPKVSRNGKQGLFLKFKGEGILEMNQISFRKG